MWQSTFFVSRDDVIKEQLSYTILDETIRSLDIPFFVYGPRIFLHNGLVHLT